MDTSVGLSTIASLSLGLSMSMTGSGRAVICRNLGSAFPMPIPTSPRSAGAQRGGTAADVEPKFPCLPQLPPRAVGVGGALQASLPVSTHSTCFSSALTLLVGCQEEHLIYKN